MSSQLTAYITLFSTSGVINLYLCMYVFLRRHQYTNISYYFMFYTAAISIYCFGSALGLTATTLEQLKFWNIILYIGMPVSAPLGLLFAMKYLGMKIKAAWALPLLSISVISFLMVATNDFHHLHYRVFEIDPVLGAPFVQQEIGSWYMIHGIFTFVSMFVAFFLMLSRWRETAKVYRAQLLFLMIGQFVPMVTAFIYLLGFTPPGIDPVPMVLWFTSLLYVWSINSTRMFTVMPIAKDSIFNSINDGVIVLDESHRMIEFNEAYKSMFPSMHKSMVGMDFKYVWLGLTGEAFPLDLDSADITSEIQLKNDDTPYIYQVRMSPLQHANNRKGLLLIFTEVTELKRLQLELENRAYYDDLTQIYNRRAFFEKSEHEFSLTKQTASPYSIILMDIDYFKKVNDTFGHDVGDQLLMHVVHVCQTDLKEDVLFARYGGEEFVIGLNNYTGAEAEIVANQLRLRLESKPLIMNDVAISITISSGLAEASEDTEETLHQLLKKADKALYVAKRQGRNQVQVYAEDAS
ncbi:histidine kinase N-terminal 7TM domain-containing diguanylate cyclase [Alkalicoccobacillus murimartini]|uniref:Diguanylate cyclase (GGDEF)-like protein/PAS domain S-box-containing protein n=1 Tax=Alkalicoccobacillus murimartini TaxID=171685 RepID=A0ABT9YHM8_9BACI|nr:diguanylate cyclase [Alkalicoccobacillus murimartini]MDQ0207365.1 diguanylate cyclase (GGDEF)-like protein/PAS domain S-box-containing protein [Alkalicoccobacillus murimartini]